MLFTTAASGCGVTLTHPATASGPAAQSVYLVQNGSGHGATGSILRFAATSNGSVAPEATLTGPAGKQILFDTVDGLGQLYVGACPPSLLGGCEVDIYPAGASGSTSPTRTLVGSSLGNAAETFVGVSGVAIDKSGNLYIDGVGKVLIFNSGAEGSASAARIVQPLVESPARILGLAVDPSGYLYLSTAAAGSANCQLLVLPPGASGSVAPLRSIPVGAALLNCPVAVDTNGNVYVGSTMTDPSTGKGQTTQIQEFAGGATGSNVPLRTIAGAATGLSYLPAIAVDSAGYVYAVNGTLPPKAGSLSVDVFSPTANGSAAPVSAFTSGSFDDYSGTQIGLF